MKRAIIGCVIGFVVIVGIPLTLFTLEYKRESDVCLSANSSVKNAQEAKNAVRNYHGQMVIPDVLSKLRQNELFQSDGFGVNGGWSVQKWTRLIAVMDILSVLNFVIRSSKSYARSLSVGQSWRTV